MAETYKIKESWMRIWVHDGPGVSYKRTDIIRGTDDKEYTVSERKNNYWLKIGENRWVCDRDSNGMMVMEKTGTSNTEEVKPEEPAKPGDGTGTEGGTGDENPDTSVEEESFAYVPDTELIKFSDEEFFANLEDNFTISNIRGIFGMPYQFMESADPRVSNKPDAIGRKYAKEIVSNMPLLLMTPGKPRFMAEYGDEDRKSILEKFVESAFGLEDKIKETILTKDFGKYYSLEYDYKGYFNYVNPMCRAAARMMNLHNTKIDGTNLDNYEWSSAVNENFNKIFSIYKGCTAWYCDSETSISDSFGNDTAESMIGSKINSLSDYGRELNFILGTVKGQTGIALDKYTSAENLEKSMEKVNDTVNNIMGQDSTIGGIFKTLTNSIQTVVAGGKLVFPEIWSGSSFGRSYSVKLKLVSPDADDLSIYLNIIVPILHLLGLVLPREAGKSHGYISPFLVRAFYKGLFNVDMGIITDLSIDKGKESAWTPSGVPTTVDVSFTIKDLYNDIYMSNMSNMKHNMMNNIILMDYIGNLCGININEPDVMRGIDMFLTQNVQNRITDTWHMNIMGSLNQWITNKTQAIFGKF